MPGFKPGAVVKVPFPYTDRATRQRRPALVIGAQPDHDLLWLAMITSAENRPWAGDVIVNDLAPAGLPAPSVVRPAKIATLDARDAELIGQVSLMVLTKVLSQISDRLGA